VTKEEISGGFLAIYAVEADDMTIEGLSWFIDDSVAKQLLGIEGMAEVNRFGGVDREIEVILDLARMQALGVTASQINGLAGRASRSVSSAIATMPMRSASARSSSAAGVRSSSPMSPRFATAIRSALRLARCVTRKSSISR
jgi:multidrug efflux pump subunit AcrB